jgi:pseudaminic acid synthase
LGQVRYEVSKNEKSSRLFRKSLFVIKDIKTGEKFSAENIRSIRPGYGLLPKNMDYVMGRKASMDISRGTPLIWEMIG